MARATLRDTAARLVAMPLAVVSLAACASSPSLAPGDVEQQITDGLTEQVGGEFEVTCPSPLPAEAGYTFTCDVTDRTGGRTVAVTVVEDDDAGTFRWRVTTPSPSAGTDG